MIEELPASQILRQFGFVQGDQLGGVAVNLTTDG